ncbi:unnamed protein product [Polarella glacialis]|uniref:Uncharacterized protein n=1 Tax=Polarella glacialis TaxID=89957 RepID=A0A813LJN5_POLGL|nr:unnamed protein product [Polarella glacialis]
MKFMPGVAVHGVACWFAFLSVHSADGLSAWSPSNFGVSSCFWHDEVVSYWYTLVGVRQLVLEDCQDNCKCAASCACTPDEYFSGDNLSAEQLQVLQALKSPASMAEWVSALGGMRGSVSVIRLTTLFIDPVAGLSPFGCIFCQAVLSIYDRFAHARPKTEDVGGPLLCVPAEVAAMLARTPFGEILSHGWGPSVFRGLQLAAGMSVQPGLTSARLQALVSPLPPDFRQSFFAAAGWKVRERFHAALEARSWQDLPGLVAEARAAAEASEAVETLEVGDEGMQRMVAGCNAGLATATAELLLAWLKWTLDVELSDVRDEALRGSEWQVVVARVNAAQVHMLDGCFGSSIHLPSPCDRDPPPPLGWLLLLTTSWPILDLLELLARAYASDGPRPWSSLGEGWPQQQQQLQDKEAASPEESKISEEPLPAVPCPSPRQPLPKDTWKNRTRGTSSSRSSSQLPAYDLCDGQSSSTAITRKQQIDANAEDLFVSVIAANVLEHPAGSSLFELELLVVIGSFGVGLMGGRYVTNMVPAEVYTSWRFAVRYPGNKTMPAEIRAHATGLSTEGDCNTVDNDGHPKQDWFLACTTSLRISAAVPPRLLRGGMSDITASLIFQDDSGRWRHLADGRAKGPCSLAAGDRPVSYLELPLRICKAPVAETTTLVGARRAPGLFLCTQVLWNAPALEASWPGLIAQWLHYHLGLLGADVAYVYDLDGSFNEFLAQHTTNGSVAYMGDFMAWSLKDAAVEYHMVRGVDYLNAVLRNPQLRVLLGQVVFDHCLFAAKRARASAVMQLHSVDSFLLPTLELVESWPPPGSGGDRALVEDLVGRLQDPENALHSWLQLRSVNFGAGQQQQQQEQQLGAGRSESMSWLGAEHQSRASDFDPWRNVPVARPEEVDYLDIHYAIPRSQFAERTKLPLVLDPWSDWRVNHYTDLNAVRCQQTPVIQNVSEDGSASLGVWQHRKDSSDRYQGLPCTVSDDRLVAVTAALRRRSGS